MGRAVHPLGAPACSWGSAVFHKGSQSSGNWHPAILSGGWHPTILSDFLALGLRGCESPGGGGSLVLRPCPPSMPGGQEGPLSSGLPAALQSGQQTWFIGSRLPPTPAPALSIPTSLCWSGIVLFITVICSQREPVLASPSPSLCPHGSRPPSPLGQGSVTSSLWVSGTPP